MALTGKKVQRSGISPTYAWHNPEPVVVRGTGPKWPLRVIDPVNDPFKFRYRSVKATDVRNKLAGMLHMENTSEGWPGTFGGILDRPLRVRFL
jgi:hypothetical protein